MIGRRGLTRFAAALIASFALGGLPEARAGNADDEWRTLSVAAPARATRPTLRTKSCELSGTLDMYSSFYATESAAAPIFYVAKIEIARLSPARERAGRVPLSIEWPIVASGWLAQDQLPFELTERVEVVKEHLWLGEGARVSAHGVKDGLVRIVRPDAGAGDTRSDPSGYEAAVKCSIVALAKARPFSPPGAAARALAGRVDFSAAPKGNRIASFHFGTGVEVRILEHRKGWMRVRGGDSSMEPASYGYLPFDFDAWTREAAPVEADGILGGLIALPVPPTHVTTLEAPLRDAPAPSTATIARLAKGVPFVAGRRTGGFVAIKLPNVGRPSIDRDFWLSEADLASAAKPLTR